MRKYLIITLLSGCVAWNAPRVWAEQENDDEAHLTYRIPEDAQRYARESGRERDIVEVRYFPKGKTPQRSEMLGIERLHKGTRVELRLFKNEKEHGIQREWYNNGKPKSEIPRKNGGVHGWCKHWDEEGNLVSQYRITNGVGARREYYLNGQLKSETEMPKRTDDSAGLFGCVSSNAQTQTSIVCNCEWRCALSAGMFTNGHVQYLAWDMRGSATRSLTFHPNGSVSFIAWYPGPIISFREDGSVEKKEWRVGLTDVSESDYARRAEKDPYLPPYYPDASQYKRFVDDKVKAIIEKYEKLPRVKFPLEFDRDGNPALLSFPAN